MACRISVPRPGIKLTPLVVKATGSPGNVQESLFKNWVLPNCSPWCLHQFISQQHMKVLVSPHPQQYKILSLKKKLKEEKKETQSLWVTKDGMKTRLSILPILERSAFLFVNYLFTSFAHFSARLSFLFLLNVDL